MADVVEAWSVQDDLLLRNALEQGASLAALAAGAVTFSRPFTEEEMTERWRALLFDPEVSTRAAIRMAAAEPAPPPPPPVGDDMQTIMAAWRSNPKWRTTRSAAAGEGGGASVPPPLDDAGAAPTFSEVEDALIELGPRTLQLGPTWTNHDARVAARAARRQDVALLQRLERSTRAATDRAAKGAFATLRGVNSRFLMRKHEVLIGRGTDEQKVDIDMGLEGNASRVSRQHAFVQLRKDGKFYLRNVGRRAVFVNGAPVEAWQRAQLPADCVIEIGGLRLLFMPNARARVRPASPVAPAEPQPDGDAAMDADDTAAGGGAE